MLLYGWIRSGPGDRHPDLLHGGHLNLPLHHGHLGLQLDSGLGRAPLLLRRQLTLEVRDVRGADGERPARVVVPRPGG